MLTFQMLAVSDLARMAAKALTRPDIWSAVAS